MKKDALDDFLVEKPNKKRTGSEVYLWWESQRFKYNKICFTVGTLNIILILFTERNELLNSKSVAIFGPILTVVIVVSLIGNLFYFLGWFIELFTSRNEKIGPILFIILTGIVCGILCSFVLLWL